MARSGPLLTHAQRKKIAPFLPQPPKQPTGGRPRIANRRVLEGILWILRSGARWQDLPEKFPHPSKCWRRLRDWEERGVWLNIWRTFLSELGAVFVRLPKASVHKNDFPSRTKYQIRPTR